MKLSAEFVGDTVGMGFDCTRHTTGAVRRGAHETQPGGLRSSPGLAYACIE